MDLARLWLDFIWLDLDLAWLWLDLVRVDLLWLGFWLRLDFGLILVCFDLDLA